MTAAERPARKFPLRLDRLAGRAGASGAPGAGSRPLLRPQRDLAAAHADARHRAAPAGLGLDSADVRRRMVERLRAEGVRNEALLAAFAAVPRHLFIDAGLATQAYEDTSLPIGHGQTISKPSVVARMIELLQGGANARRDGRLGRVLEIGTGSGYQAALLSRIADTVVSVERLKALHERAQALLAALRSPGLRLVYADGRLGHPPNAPYDAIVAAAGGEAIPEPWLAQLAIGGRLVAPVVLAGGQALVVVDRDESGLHRRVQEAVKFVP